MQSRCSPTRGTSSMAERSPSTPAEPDDARGATHLPHHRRTPMAWHVVTRSAVALALVAGGAVAQGGAPASELASLPVNATGASTDTWVRATTSAAAILKQAIALDLRSVPLNDALTEISRAALITIQRGPDVLASRALVSLHVANLPVAEALATVLDGTGLAAYVSLGGDAVLVARPPLDETAAHTKRRQEAR